MKTMKRKNFIMLVLILGFSLQEFAQVPIGYTILNTHNDEDITWYEVTDDSRGGIGVAYDNKVIITCLETHSAVSYSHGYFFCQYNGNKQYFVYDKNGKSIDLDGEGGILSGLINGFEIVNGELYMSHNSGIYDSHCKKIADKGSELIRSGNSVYLKNKKEKGKYGIYDLEKEKQVLDPQYGYFDLVVRGDLCIIKEDGGCCIYDLKNEKIIPMPSIYDKIWLEEIRMDGYGTNEFRYRVNLGDKSGVLDINGKEIIAPNNYDHVQICNIEDDYYYIVEKEGKEGVCDKNGREIMVPNYFDKVKVEGRRDDFYYIVKRDGKRGVYDMYGIEIIEPKYENIYLKKTGDYYYFKVNCNDKQGVCDMHGHEIIAPRYDLAYMSISESGHYYYRVKRKDKEGIYNLDGQEIIVPKKYKNVMLCATKDGRYYYYVEKNGKGGFCDKNGQEIIAPKYDEARLEEIDNQRCCFVVERNGKKGVIDMNGKTIIALKKCKSLYYDNYVNNTFVYQDASGNRVSTGISLDMNGDPYINAYYGYNKSIAEGKTYFEKKNYSKAAENYKKALEYLQRAETYYDVGASYYNLEKYDDAITYFQYCLYSAPDESLKAEAHNLINLSRQFIAQKEAQRQEAAGAIIGGVVGITSTILFNNNNLQSNYGTNDYNQIMFQSNNMNYSLDPYVIWNQAVQEVQQQQEFINNTAQQTWNQAKEQVEREQQQLHDQIKNSRKWDGSEYTETEILEIMNNIYAERMGNQSNSNGGNGFDSGGGSEYKGELTPEQYEDLYRRFEKSVQGFFNGLTINGYKTEDKQGNIKGTTVGKMPTVAYITSERELRDAQKEMKRIREEAARYGVIIQQSQWETARAGY